MGVVSERRVSGGVGDAGHDGRIRAQKWVCGSLDGGAFVVMVAVMNVALTAHGKGFIRRMIESGRYNNASEVVRAALRRMDGVEGERFPAGRIEHLRHAAERNRFRLAFRVAVKSKTPTPVDYSLDCEIVGLFRFPEDSTEETMQGLIRLNGCTILYGILRGQLANITGAFPRQKLILPTVMMEEVVNEVEREKAQAREAIPSGGRRSPKKAAKQAKSRAKK